MGYLRFDFYNGAMSTEQCRRLRAAYAHARTRGTRVIVLLGGHDYFSNGIHLNVIEAAEDPGAESWRNLNAIDDLVRDIVETDSHLVISALAGDAAAGGVPLALAADYVVAREDIVLNPYYRHMGDLYGSEYWTYLLPRRIGATLTDAPHRPAVQSPRHPPGGQDRTARRRTRHATSRSSETDVRGFGRANRPRRPTSGRLEGQTPPAAHDERTQATPRIPRPRSSPDASSASSAPTPATTKRGAGSSTRVRRRGPSFVKPREATMRRSQPTGDSAERNRQTSRRCHQPADANPRCRCESRSPRSSSPPAARTPPSSLRLRRSQPAYIAWAAVSTAGGALTGRYPDPGLAKAVVTDANVKPGSLTGASVAASALGIVPSASTALDAVQAPSADHLGGSPASAATPSQPVRCS